MRLANSKPAAPAPPQDERPVMQAKPTEDGHAPGFELALVPTAHTIVPSQFFAPQGSDQVIAALEVEVRKQAATLDISTEDGRKAIASLAYKVAKTKTGLDGARKDLVADRKEEIKAVDKEGSRIWDRLEALQAEVRKPLTDWETANTERLAGHNAAIATLEAVKVWANDKWQSADLEQMNLELQGLRCYLRDWQEFAKRGAQARDLAEIAVAEAIERRTQHDHDQAELKRLRAEDADRKEKERLQAVADAAAAEERRKADERMAEQQRSAEAERLRVEAERYEAAAKAQQAEAERVAQLERERIEREAVETKARLERQLAEEREQAEQRRLEAQRVAEEQADRARLALIEAEQRSAREAAAAAEKADQERAAAVEAERSRQENIRIEQERIRLQEVERVRAENEARENNKAHRRKVEKAAADAIIANTAIGQDSGGRGIAEILINAIAAGKIPHVTITY